MFVVTGLPVASLVGYSVIPLVGWRVMFVIGGIGALSSGISARNCWFAPRLEATGRLEEAEALLQSIEAETAKGPPPPAPAM